MKKLGRILLAFPVGVAMLTLTFLAIYLIGGNEVYLDNINQLQNPKVLAEQSACAGIIYMAVIFALQGLYKLRNADSSNTSKLIGAIAYIAVYGIVTIGVDKMNNFNEEVIDLFAAISTVIFVVVTLGYIVKDSIDSCKVNKALKNRKQD